MSMFPCSGRVALSSLLVLLLMALALPALAQEEGSLFVTTDPPNARIRLLYVKNKFSQGVKLPPGNYMIDIQADGYETVYKEVSIAAGKPSKISVSLKAKPGAKPDGKPEDKKPEEAKAPDKKDEKKDDKKDEKKDEKKDAADEPTGELFVDVTPAGATIRLLSVKPKFQQGIALPPGKYRVEISKEGHATKEVTATVKSKEKTRMAVTLEKDAAAKPDDKKDDKKDAKKDEAKKKEEKMPPTKKGHGRLYVDLQPEDAKVRLLKIKDKFEQGMELKAGKYTLEVLRRGHESQTLRFEIKDGKPTRLEVALAPEAQPDQADLPPAAPLAPVVPPANGEGPTQVLPPSEAKVMVSTNATEPKDALAPRHGKLTLSIIPPDAAAMVVELETPYQPGMALPQGNYTLSFIKEGYADHLERVVIEEGKVVSLTVQLKPEEGAQAATLAKLKEMDAPDVPAGSGRLFMETEPADAAVMVLNIKPKFQQGIELKAGAYRLEIRRDGFAPQRVVVKVPPRKAVTYKVSLSPEVAAPAQAMPNGLPSGQISGKPQPPALPPGKDPVQARAQLEEARRLLERGKADQALEPLTKALELDGSLLEAFKLRAQAHKMRKDPAKAVEDFNKFLLHSNLDAVAFEGRGQALLELKQMEGACHDFWMACGLDQCAAIKKAQEQGFCQ